MKVSVVIPSSNGRRFLSGCLEALHRTELPAGASLEPIVVDNGSTDGSAELLSRFPAVRAVVHPERLGFARANNAARAVATGDVICFLNNDTMVEPGWVRRPLELFASDPTIHGVGSKLLFMHRFVAARFSLPGEASAIVSSRVFGSELDDKVRFSPDVGLSFPVEGEAPCRRLRDGSIAYVPLPIAALDPHPVRAPALRVVRLEGAASVAISAGLAHESSLTRFPGIVALDTLEERRTVRLVQNAGTFINARGEGGDVGSGELHSPESYAREEVVPALCGAALFVRRSALDAVGWFPDYYRVYYEDVDLCLRLRAAGGILVFCPSSIVNHYHTGTNREWSPAFIENVSRSSLLFVSRFGSARMMREAVVGRVRNAAAEFARNGLLRAPLIWTRAHGTRGAVKALPALGRVLRERASAGLRRIPTSELLTFQRTPYASASPQER